MAWAAVVGAGVSLAGSAYGADQAKKSRGDADSQRQQALAQFANLSPPDIEKLKLSLQQYGNAGNLSPEMVQLISQGDTSLSNVSTDPRLRASQASALSGIEQVANTGMNSADQAGYELARRNAAGEAQAKQNQILQGMQQRGEGGSGNELLANLQNAQSGSDRLQQAQLQEAQARQQARQQALMQQSQMSSNLRGQDYSEQANLANARDQISRFNATNAQNVNQTNTGVNNQAQQFNLTNQQNLHNMNTGMNNQSQQYNKNLAVDDYNRQYNLAGARSGAFQAAATGNDTRAGQTAGMYAGAGQGIGTMIAAAGNKPAGTVYNFNSAPAQGSGGEQHANYSIPNSGQELPAEFDISKLKNEGNA